MSEQAFTNLASVRIKVGGQAADDYEHNLEEVVVETVFNLPAMATIRLHDPEVELIDDPIFDVGKAIEIEMVPPASFGTEGGTVFKGEIVALEPYFSASGQHIFEIRAYDKLHRLLVGRRTQTYTKMTDAAIVKKIVQDAGLQGDVDATPYEYEYVLQYNQTDMEFLSERARRLGYLLYVQDEKLYFKKPSTRTPGPELVLGEALRSFRPRLSAAQQPATYETRGWDPLRKEVISGKYNATPSVWVQNGYDEAGGQAARAVFSASKTSYSFEANLHSSGHAQAMAEADAQAREGDFVEGEGVAFLAPKIQAGVELKLTGLGSRFSGKYFVTSATHYYNAHGGETHFSVTGRYPHTVTDLIRPDGKQASSYGRIDGVVVGIVTNNNDPEGLLRVRVKFPWMPLYGGSGGAEIESAWAKIAAPDAGQGRGFVYMPEINDEVLVAFEHGDVNRPYVVGMLWNQKDKPPEKTNQVSSNGKVQRRVLYSRTGHIIILDDSDNAPQVLIQDKKKNQLLIDTKTDSITIKAAKDITIDAGGNLTLKAGQNITLDARANITGKAGAKMDFQANAQYNVKSAMVAIKGDGTASVESTVLDLKANGMANLQSSGTTAIKGALITLN